MRMTGRGYLLAALAATVAVAGCTAADAQANSANGSPATANGPAAPGTFPAGRPATPECTAADLRITVSPGYGANDTAGGHAELALWFTNVGARGCFMRGYPGVEVSRPGGALNAQRELPGDAGQAASQVTIPPGGTASAWLGWEFFPRDGSGTVTTEDCPGYHATRLLVTVPDQTTSTVLAAPNAETPVCWEFVVDPVVLGAAGWS